MMPATVAAGRVVWVEHVRAHRQRLAGAWATMQRQLGHLDDVARRLERGATAEGRPYTAATLRQYRQARRSWARAYADTLGYFRWLATVAAPPTYQQWRDPRFRAEWVRPGAYRPEAERWLRDQLDGLNVGD
jgi:hypothetical protein